ncbi:hypothetical protein N7E81_10890 [Reichenbachiella carrageenanivorans]|uniref:Apea-like HEPN domain-containing protein n=1 Tax=Reichenbachiella carrageenanivorans TaxID=2979869 RepID=A0ABY6CVH9_9BACT|nr:hypothetical protein [Reichenbachiella carrageenanivorans]UXX77873.1 hypothetical protein N7E81_10890 [Reichenbachiella carrageenanivorans]
MAKSIFLLKDLRESKSTLGDICTINASITLNLAATIEGVLASTYTQTLKKDPRYKNTARINDFDLRRTFDQKIKKIESEGFESKLQLFKDTLHINIKTFNTYKAINALFQYRNVLAHGGKFEYKRNKVDDWIVDEGNCETKQELEHSDYWVKKPLISYLKENNLLYPPKNNKGWKILLDDSLFTNDIADHFVARSKTFLSDLLLTNSLDVDILDKHFIKYLGLQQPLLKDLYK